MKILITGVAGFIGYHLANRLLKEGHLVIGIDNMNNYYDVSLKQARLFNLLKENNFHFEYLNLANKDVLGKIFKEHRFDRVINLAAQAGVRYSLTNPQSYIDSNIQGFLNILENCRHHEIEHLIYASSSSVYGASTRMPFSIHQNVDHPLSLYAATKKSNELMAHSYSHLYQLPTTGLRFFTVYGPWGRPDMALFLFTKAILEGKPINLFNHGNMSRDFTYIDDIVEGLVRVTNSVPTANPDWNGETPDPGSSKAPYRIYNIGNNNPVQLMVLLLALEEALGKKSLLNMMPMQPGDVPASWADVSDLEQDFDFYPKTPIHEGVAKFVNWYKRYYLNEEWKEPTPSAIELTGS